MKIKLYNSISFIFCKLTLTQYQRIHGIYYVQKWIRISTSILMIIQRSNTHNKYQNVFNYMPFFGYWMLTRKNQKKTQKSQFS